MKVKDLLERLHVIEESIGGDNDVSVYDEESDTWKPVSVITCLPIDGYEVRLS